MFKNLKKFKFFIVAGMVILGLGVVSLFYFNYPSKASDVMKLKSPLYQESIEPHPITPDSLEGKIVEVVKKVSPAVVSISTERTVTTGGGFLPYGGEEPFDEFFKRFFEQFPQRSFKQRGLGSGMIISKDGYILTNAHVIYKVDRDKIMVTLPDGRSLKAKVVGTSEEMDISVLKIKGDDLPVVTLGNSDNLNIGEWAIAIGNPFGFSLSQLNKKYEPTVTLGIISATDRAIQAGGVEGGETRVYTGLIQTDAAINPGNSGGPLINIYGEVIGINTAILSPSHGSIGIGFAIPINKAKTLLQSLKKYGEMRQAWVGIWMQELTPELSQKFGVEKGVLISGIAEGSPAEKAGIQPGDIVQEINGKFVNSPLELREEIIKREVGEKINITLIRKKKKIVLSLTIGQKPKKISEVQLMENKEEKLLGIKVASITSQLREKYNIGEDEEGVVITEVKSGSPARNAGLTSGDVIRGVNKKLVKNLNDFRDAIQDVKSGDMVSLKVKHGIWSMTIILQTQE